MNFLGGFTETARVECTALQNMARGRRMTTKPKTTKPKTTPSENIYAALTAHAVGKRRRLYG